MKPIKFDLPLNGTKITNLADLENNLCAELFIHFRSGKLAKWLRVRKLDEQADAVETLLAEENEHEVKLLKRLCDVFREVEESEARESLELYKKNSPEISNSNDDEIERLKAEIERLNVEIQLLKTPPKPEGVEIENFIIHENGTVTDTKTGLMWQRKPKTEKFTWNGAINFVKKLNAERGFAGYSDWRLPTIEELESLVNHQYEPAIHQKVFSNIASSSSRFWSSSSHSRSYKNFRTSQEIKSAWVALFCNKQKMSDIFYENDNYCAWLVRG